MSNVPRLIIRFTAPTVLGVPLQITPPLGQPTKGLLRLPFQVQEIGLVIRALEGRHNPSQQEWAERLWPGNAQTVAATLAAMGLWQGSQNNGWVAEDIVKRVGQMLGASLFYDKNLRDALQTLDAAMNAEGEVVLAFEEEAMPLAALPWEAAYIDGRPLLLAHGKRLACTRTMVFRHTVRPPRPFGKPLLILTVSPKAWMTGVLEVFQQQARTALMQALAGTDVQVEVLPQATMTALEERLRAAPPVDVLDYVGHGVVTENGGALVMDEFGKDHRFVSTDNLAALPNLPSLIVLGACLGARVDPDEPLTNLAVGLSASGVQAVVAMQFTVNASAIAQQIVPAFYQSLAAGASVQQAVAEARNRLLSTETEETSWYLPALYIAALDVPVIIPTPRAPMPTNPFLSHNARLNPQRYFIGRDNILRRVWDVIKSKNSGASIYGPSGSGRTAMLDRIEEGLPEQIENPAIIRLAVHYGSREDELKMQLVEQLGGSSAKKYLELLRGRRVVLLIDNLNEIDSAGMPGWKARSWLRSLTQLDTRNYTVQLVVTSLLRLKEHFAADEKRASPLHGVLSNAYLLEPLTKTEAKQFLLTHITGTPLDWFKFSDLIEQPRYPEELRQLCQQRWDELTA